MQIFCLHMKWKFRECSGRNYVRISRDDMFAGLKLIISLICKLYTWKDKFIHSLFQTWKTYKHRNSIFPILISSDIPTFYQVLVFSHILYSTARFLGKSHILQLGVRVITFFQKLNDKRHILLNVTVRNIPYTS